MLSQGFTLLEILVALVVLAALLAGLTQGVQFGIRAWNSQLGAVAANADLDTVDRTLRTLIASAEPPQAPDRPSLQGQAGSLQFAAALPEGAPVQDTRMAQITVLLVGKALVLRWMEQPHAKLLGAMPDSHEEVLLRGVSKLGFSYRDKTGAWTDSWTQPTLPQLVRIHLEFGAKSARRWPDMVIAPMRDGINETGN